MNFTKAKKTTETATVVLHNGGIRGNGYNIVSWRSIKNGKPSGKTFSKQFETEAEAEAFYDSKA